MGEESNLFEQVSQELLDEATEYTVTIVDSNTRKRAPEYSVQVKLNNPYDFDPSPFIPKDRIMDLPAFYSLAAEVIEDSQDRAGILPEERVVLVQEYQPERFNLIGDEVITAKVLRREPARMNTKGTGRPQRASGYDYTYRDPKYPNKAITIESRPIDHRIEFACWAMTAELANARALWLEKLFITHAWAFQIQGVERFFWEGRGPDTLWKHGEQRLHQRPLVFFVRLREHEVHAHSVIKRIDYQAYAA